MKVDKVSRGNHIVCAHTAPREDYMHITAHALPFTKVTLTRGDKAVTVIPREYGDISDATLIRVIRTLDGMPTGEWKVDTTTDRNIVVPEWM